ncbi:HD domain-containing protein [Enterovibrio sp. ZSDZ35]|uniref:HD domain-containing protein n=1 Tax=Enterovibrio qingdaonensis TaxID=2899818 RepID=A0ABT5QH70_9GAMM|nr:HD domain-containing protein [Enterovibrio sp. ZSDZ35]MDD1780327.1 HD domain-containing protein [Enterovibrio sp. ZSDZ35]
MTTDTAHDTSHILRVVKTAESLCERENANKAIVLPAAYLHDCFTFPKNHPERKESSRYAADKAIAFLQSINYPAEYLEAIHHAIVAHSFSANITPETVEAKIVQDADRLDALGAVGVARCLLVGASFDRQFYALNDPFCTEREPDDYTYTLDHFYTKLLGLPSTMQTVAARREGEKRVAFMNAFLEQLNHEI